jgi:hypothetical protein
MTKTTVFALSCAMTAAATYGQAWVSASNGLDGNPCTRTSPCRTFQHAHDVTASFGQVNVLDPGDYGTLSITKAITIDGGGLASNLITGGSTGIIVQANAGDVVQLKNLSLHGNAGGNGIVYSSGSQLHIDGVNVNGFGYNCIAASTGSSSADLVIKNTSIDNCSSAAINIYGTKLTVEIENTHSHFVNLGLYVLAGAVTVSESSFSSPTENSSGTVGIYALYYYAPVTIMVDNCVVSGFGAGVQANYGTIQVSRSTITNSGTGVLAESGAAVNSNGNNSLFNNVANGAFSHVIGLQ